MYELQYAVFLFLCLFTINIFYGNAITVYLPFLYCIF
uniref:Uncharacterized protein n=1 Tax=Arundo donax TaxID=35708 RepID=A0A0A8ZDV2_ARUDO